MSESSAVPGRLRRALPRLLLVAAAVVLAVVTRSVFAAVAFAIFLVALAMDGRAWWHYVVTGDRSSRVAAAYGEPGVFSVQLLEAGERQIEAIKAVREVTGIGLAEAKGHVMAAPSVIVVRRSEASARRIVERLQRAGATATVVRPS